MCGIMTALRTRVGPAACLSVVAPALPAAAAEVKLPQLDIGSYPSQIFWLIVSFIVLYVLVSRWAMPRIEEVLDNRERQRIGDLDKAAALNMEADQIHAEYERSRRDAHDKAHAETRAAQEEIAANAADAESGARETVADMLQQAEQRIAAARADSVGNIQSVACDLAAEAAARLVAMPVTAEQAAQAVDEVMAERNR